jgi:two-component system LytT family response regulator
VIRVLIVDDERPARTGLRLRLAQARGFEVVAEAASGRAAIAAIQRHEPDLAFLDIRLPDMNGFEVLRAIPEERRPRVIFVTAHDQHALTAFEVHALDYLLKPIASDRFEAALERARSEHVHRLASRVLEELSEGMRAGPSGRDAAAGPATLDRLSIREGARVRIVPVASIQWIEASGNYVTVHAGGRALLHRVALTELERQLPPRRFARVHRGAIVNLAEVVEVRCDAHGDGEVALRDGTRVRMSRRYRDALT